MRAGFREIPTGLSSTGGDDGGAMYGGATKAADGKVYLAPGARHSVGVVDPATNSFSEVPIPRISSGSSVEHPR